MGQVVLFQEIQKGEFERGTCIRLFRRRVDLSKECSKVTFGAIPPLHVRMAEFSAN